MTRVSILVLSLSLAFSASANAATVDRCQALFDSRNNDQPVIHQLAQLRAEIKNAVGKGDSSMARILYGEYHRVYRQAAADGIDFNKLDSLDRADDEKRVDDENRMRKLREVERKLVPMEMLHELDGDYHTQVQEVKFTDDGSHMISIGDKDPILWDTSNWAEVDTYSFEDRRTGQVSMSANGRRVAILSEDHAGGLFVFETVSTKQAKELVQPEQDPLWSVEMSRDGRLVQGRTGSGVLVVWDSNKKKPLFSLTGADGSFSESAFSPDGSRIIARTSADRAVIIDVAKKAVLTELAYEYPNIENAVFSPDGKHMYFSYSDGIAAVDLATGAPIFKGATHKNFGVLRSMAVSPGGTRLAIGGMSGQIEIWDTTTGKRLHSLKGAHKNQVVSLSFSNDGESLASGSFDGSVGLWRTERGALEQRLLLGPTNKLMPDQYTRGTIHSVAYKPAGDKEILAVGSDQPGKSGMLTIWRRP